LTNFCFDSIQEANQLSVLVQIDYGHL
jgi:hypothetical protein